MISADYHFFDKGIINHNFILWYQLQQREKPQTWNFMLFAAFGQPAWCNKRTHIYLLSEPLLPCFRIANTCKTLCKYLITTCNVTEWQDHSQSSSPLLSWAGIAKVALCLHFLWAYTILLLSTLQNSLVTDEIPCRDDRTQCRSSRCTLTGEHCTLQWARVCQKASEFLTNISMLQTVSWSDTLNKKNSSDLALNSGLHPEWLFTEAIEVFVLRPFHPINLGSRHCRGILWCMFRVMISAPSVC